MPESIKASEQNLDKVFCDEYLFEIPFYQRPYAWTTDEVGETAGGSPLRHEEG